MQKKNNWLMKLGCGFAVLFCLWAILRVTNTLQYYSITTWGNSPTIKKGDIVWTSRFKTLQRGNFIAFKQYDSLAGGISVWVKHCVGMPGDAIEMRNGLLFVNSKNFDVNYTINNEFLIYTDDKDKFINALSLWKQEETWEDNPRLFVTLNAKQYKKVQSMLIAGKESIEQIIYPENIDNQPTFFAELGKTHWTVDNFGPLTVPYEHYFVLGDNRHNSQDSRYIGFIKKDDYVRTVLGK